MKEYVFSQLENFNFITIIIMITFVTTMSRLNTVKLLKQQSEEIYKEFEELKDEIRGQHQSITALINGVAKK